MFCNFLIICINKKQNQAVIDIIADITGSVDVGKRADS
jgi:hypothetical protein